MTDDNMLQAVGEALYGPRWTMDLSRELRVSDRTIRRWASDPNSIPDGLWGELLDVLMSHSKNIDHAKARVMAKLAMLQGSPTSGGFQTRVTSAPRPPRRR